jgi:hypothetical protein
VLLGKTNFAYGSTPYQTFRAITRFPAVAQALVSCTLLPAQEKEGAEGEGDVTLCGGVGGAVVVWGSSLGWLVFYAALTYGVRSRGVELLEVLSLLALLVQKYRY